MTRPHLKIAELEPRGEPLAYTAKEVGKLLDKQRRNLRRRTIMLVFFQMAAIGALMFTARFFAVRIGELAWLLPHMPKIAQACVIVIWFFGVLYIFRKEQP